jgi:hypothetical protein
VGGGGEGEGGACGLRAREEDVWSVTLKEAFCVPRGFEGDQKSVLGFHNCIQDMDGKHAAVVHARFFAFNFCSVLCAITMLLLTC